MPKHKKKYPHLPHGEYNKRNCKKGETEPTQIGGLHRKVTNGEKILIFKHEITDRELSKKINRSVKSIHMIRHKIKTGIYLL